jgi:hypothetical protein
MSEVQRPTPSAGENRVDEKGLVRFSSGTLLVSEGDSSRKMFIIKSGKARVFRKYLGQRVTLAVLGEGEIFGEMSFFDGAPRFRRLNQQVTMLQSVYEFQKKSLKTDNCAKTVYTELLRFIKTTNLVCKHRVTESSPLIQEEIVAEAEGLVGNRYLSFRVFWNLLKEHEFIAGRQGEQSGLVTLNDAHSRKEQVIPGKQLNHFH